MKTKKDMHKIKGESCIVKLKQSKWLYLKRRNPNFYDAKIQYIILSNNEEENSSCVWYGII